MDSTSKGLKIKNGAVESPLQKKKKKKYGFHIIKQQPKGVYIR
jgi:hypothetical protein